MPIVRVFGVHLTRLGRSQMLQGPKHERNPTPPSPPADQRWGAPLGLHTHQVKTVLVRLIDDDDGYRAIGRTGGAKPHVAHTSLPRRLPPVPSLAVDTVMPFALLSISQRKGLGLFPLHKHGAVVRIVHMLHALRVPQP